MSPTVDDPTAAAACFPRVSGDEPQFSVYRYGAVAFSPRERG